MEIRVFGIVDAEPRDLLSYCCLCHVRREISGLRSAPLEMTAGLAVIDIIADRKLKKHGRGAVLF